MSVFKKALTLLIGNTNDVSYLRMPKRQSGTRLRSERELIQAESEIGRELFGPIPSGHRREFFCLDSTTCIWYEEYKTADGKTEALTTRYEIQGNKVLKVQGGSRYSYLDGQELSNVLAAIRLYYQRVMTTVYGHDPSTGRPLS